MNDTELRDWFAGQALISEAKDLKPRPESLVGRTADEVAARAYELADAMMTRRIV